MPGLSKFNQIIKMLTGLLILFMLCACYPEEDRVVSNIDNNKPLSPQSKEYVLEDSHMSDGNAVTEEEKMPGKEDNLYKGYKGPVQVHCY